MALKGELTDLSLAELIEFFCNQRKTGRLTVSYPQAPAYFYLQSGSVVHASIGSLRGIDAVFYALTQSNASFNFSSADEAPAQTINQPWTSVVLEGLRRMDEGIQPRNPFPTGPEPAMPPPAVKPTQPMAAAPSAAEPPSVKQQPMVAANVEPSNVPPRPEPAMPPAPAKPTQPMAAAPTVVEPASMQPPPAKPSQPVVAAPPVAARPSNVVPPSEPAMQPPPAKPAQPINTPPVSERPANLVSPSPAPKVQPKTDSRPPVIASAPVVRQPEVTSPRAESAQVKPRTPDPIAEVAANPKNTVSFDEEELFSQPAASAEVSDAFLSSTLASQGSHRSWKVAAIFAALVLIIAGIGVPWTLRSRARSAKAAELPVSNNESPAQASQSVPGTEAASQSAPTSGPDQSASADSSAPNSDAVDAARREREARAKEEARLKAKAADSAATTPSAPATASSTTSAPPAANNGARKVVVQVTYDENGRVTQATGSDPTALRIARQKRFPPGKAGSTTITIPLN